MEKLFLQMNLQFFAEDNDDSDDTNVSNPDGDSSDGDNTSPDEVDTSAFAELISEKDKKIEELELENKKLKKANAELTVKVTAGAKTEKSFEENLLGLVGMKPRKE